MKGRHPTPRELSAFIDGELDDVRAFAIAQHLDSCVTCLQLCHASDSLHQRLVSTELDVVPPDGLAQEILQAAAVGSEQAGGRGPVIAMALLAASGLLFMMLGAPSDLLTEGSSWGRGLFVAAGAIRPPAELQAWVAAPGVVVVAAFALLLSRRRTGPR